MYLLTKPLEHFSEEAARECQSATEVLERLPGMLTKMDPTQLTDSLTRTVFAAAAGGEAGWAELEST